MIIVYVMQGLTVAFMLLMASYLYYEWKLGAAATPSSSAAVRTVAEMLRDYDGDEVVDLGSGWGGLSIAAARACPNKRVVGIEYALPPYLWSCFRLKLNPALTNLRFLRMSFFDYKFSAKPIVFCYMPPEMMARMEGLLKELPTGAIIISNSEAIKHLHPERVTDVPGVLPEKIYVYRV